MALRFYGSIISHQLQRTIAKLVRKYLTQTLRDKTNQIQKQCLSAQAYMFA